MTLAAYAWHDAKINYIDARRSSDGTPEFYVEFSVDGVAIPFKASHKSCSQSFGSLRRDNTVRLLLDYTGTSTVICEIWKSGDRNALKDALYPFLDANFSPDSIESHSHI